MITPPYTQRCQWCGQDWWDSHVCPKLTAAAPLIPSPSFTMQVGLPQQAVAWQARKAGQEWGPPGTNKKVFDQLKAEGYEIRALGVLP